MNQPPASPNVTPSEAAALALLNDLLGLCVRQDASDLHLSPEMRPYLRIHGVLAAHAAHDVISSAQMQNLVDHLAWPFDRTPLERTGSLDGAYSAPDGTRFRFNIFRRQGTHAIALRRLESEFRSLAELGLPECLYQLCDLPDGLVLVCGPTGAGKSTTLATLLDRVNRTRPCHIVTIEDPIEYIHRPVRSLVNQRQVGGDASSFNDALVASMRQDPDVILVGEIRDLATIRTAITAAETGHLVLATVHAGDTVGAVERLVSVFAADEQGGIRRQMALVLRAVVAQHLLAADGPAGAGAAPPAAKANGTPAGTTPVRRNRVVASEILMVTPAVANLIGTAKSNQIYSAMETGAAQGMQTIEQDLARLWVGNLISEHTATSLARNPTVVRDRAAMLRKPAIRPLGGLR